MSKIDELIMALKEGETTSLPGTVWAVVDTVDWEAKTLIATSVVDGLAYYDVLLGIGSFYKRPAKGSIALLGILEGDGANAYLIDADSIEAYFIVDKTGFEWHLNEGILSMGGDGYGGIVKAPELKKQVDKNTAILKKIQDAVGQWVVTPSDGGAAFKTLISGISSMERAALENIENKKITHGNG